MGKWTSPAESYRCRSVQDAVSAQDSLPQDVSRPVRKRVGERRPMKFVDHVPDPESECGYRTVDPWVHSELKKIFIDLH